MTYLKNDLKTGILIGIGMIVIPLIIMGTRYTTEKKNKFEIHMDASNSTVFSKGFLLDTETGESWYLVGKSKFKQQ